MARSVDPHGDCNRRHALKTIGGVAVTALAGSVTAGERDWAKPIHDLFCRFLNANGAPGAAFAVGRGSKLLFARGYGIADPDQKTPVHADALFRIASISKPITAVAIFRLVEQGKLNLDDRITELLELDGYRDERWSRITILDLLRHTGGWDRDADGDPMFRSVQIARQFDVEPPAQTEHIIRWMITRPLNFDPGSRYSYSNFGYCLLGRAIERVTAMSYADAVHNLVFAPIGVTRARLGKTRQTAHGEVRYVEKPGTTGRSVFPPVGEPVPLPYGTFALEPMDAHGGWIASAPDLVRFACMLDADDPAKRLLSPEHLKLMFARPDGRAGHNDDGSPKPVCYGCGWSVRTVDDSNRINTWHSGALDGTSTILVRRHDGFRWAVLFNSRRASASRELASLIDGPVHEAVNAVTDWPEDDLFPAFRQG